jgi:hypothetical protein
MKPRISKLPHTVIVKAPGLLNMLYKPSELANELKTPLRTLYDWCNANRFAEKDNNGNLWINGKKFAAWVENQRKHPTRKLRLQSDEAYCLRCNKAVKLIDPTIQPIKGKLILIKGTCSRCGANINRGGRYDRAPELSSYTKSS